MKVNLLLVVLVGLLVSIPAAAQGRRVTNAELEKFKQKRLQAEKDYVENYARMGFPSPEELQKQLEKSRVEREALSARLAAERIAREQAEAEAEAARQSMQNIYLISQFGGYQDYVVGFPVGYGHRRGFRGFPHRGSRGGLPIRAFGAPTTPFGVPTSPFGSGGFGGGFRGRFR